MNHKEIFLNLFPEVQEHAKYLNIKHNVLPDYKEGKTEYIFWILQKLVTMRPPFFFIDFTNFVRNDSLLSHFFIPKQPSNQLVLLIIL